MYSNNKYNLLKKSISTRFPMQSPGRQPHIIVHSRLRRPNTRILLRAKRQKAVTIERSNRLPTISHASDQLHHELSEILHRLGPNQSGE